MSEARFTVPGKPVAKQRPRMTLTGRVYTPSETTRYERLVAASASAQGVRPMVGPVRVSMEIRFPIPASWTKARKIHADGAPHSQRPDLDNIAKAVLDGLNGVAWHDDAQVACVSAEKRWDAACGEGMVTVSVSAA